MTEQPQAIGYLPRIASSRAHYVFAGGFALVAVLTGLAAAGGSNGAGGMAMLCSSLCLACLFWASVNSYVRNIELRLIDIQRALETK